MKLPKMRQTHYQSAAETLDLFAGYAKVKPLKHQASITIIAVAASLLLCIGAASADALRCSNEAQACATLCAKVLNPLSKRMCLTACARRKAVCLRTGCWNNGVRSYCNLLRR